MHDEFAASIIRPTLINYYTVWKRALLRAIAAYGVNYEHVATATDLYN